MAIFTIKGVTITFRNLAGRKTDWDPNGGKRNFAIVFPEDYDTTELKAAGLDIKPFINKETNLPTGETYLRVKVNFRTEEVQDEEGNVKMKITPPIYLVNESKHKVQLTPSTAVEADSAVIRFVDLVISTYPWTYAGKSGIAAYCNRMYINIVEDELTRKYAMYDEDEDAESDEIPFE